jgi:hypothetical protein
MTLPPHPAAMSSIPRPFVAWFAILSLLLNGLMPLAVHAAEQAPAAMAICSVSGSGQADAPLKSGATHCVYCCSSTAHPAMLPAATTLPARAETISTAAPPATLHRRADLRFSSAQARAPPVMQ